jgi:hypothetical protein
MAGPTKIKNMDSAAKPKPATAVPYVKPPTSRRISPVFGSPPVEKGVKLKRKKFG